MKPYQRLSLVLVLVPAILSLGCRPDIKSGDASEIPPAVQPLAGLGAGSEETVEVASQRVASTETSLGDDSLGPFGLLAPAVPGFSLGTYASTCDPFEDPYGTCL